MLNRCEFIGNLGADPEIRSFQSGDKVANLRIACTERWKSKDGEQKERTEWISVAVFGPLVGVVERFLRKGSKVYIAGKWTTRKWQDQSGNDRYTTECVMQGPDAKLVMLDGKPEGQSSGGQSSGYGGAPAGGSDFDDSIPFAPWTHF